GDIAEDLDGKVEGIAAHKGIGFGLAPAGGDVFPDAGMEGGEPLFVGFEWEDGVGRAVLRAGVGGAGLEVFYEGGAGLNIRRIWLISRTPHPTFRFAKAH